MKKLRENENADKFGQETRTSSGGSSEFADLAFSKEDPSTISSKDLLELENFLDEAQKESVTEPSPKSYIHMIA